MLQGLSAFIGLRMSLVVLLERDLLLMLLYIAKLDLWLTFFDLRIVVARDAQAPKASTAIRSAVFVKEEGYKFKSAQHSLYMIPEGGVVRTEDTKGYDKEEPGNGRETDGGARALDTRLLF